MGANSYLSVYFFVHQDMALYYYLISSFPGLSYKIVIWASLMQQLFDLKRHTSTSDGTADD